MAVKKNKRASLKRRKKPVKKRRRLPKRGSLHFSLSYTVDRGSRLLVRYDLFRVSKVHKQETKWNTHAAETCTVQHIASASGTATDKREYITNLQIRSGQLHRTVRGLISFDLHKDVLPTAVLKHFSKAVADQHC